MRDPALVGLPLAACLAVIGVGGVRLSRSGDIIAEKSRLSRGWVGLILLVIYLLNTLFLDDYGH